MKEDFQVEGMTCGGCAGSVENTLSAIPGIESVEIDLASGKVTIESSAKASLNALQNALAPLSRYRIRHATNSSIKTATKVETNELWRKFWPLILIGLFLLSVSFVSALEASNPMQKSMEIFMSGFFLVFSFFKFLDLRGFVRSYSMYDLLAKRVTLYAWIYPFLEVGLGFAWAFVGGTFEVALFTAILMGFGALGVILAVRQKQAIQCACLGTVFELPMTSVTIIEDLLMVAMSLFFLIP